MDISSLTVKLIIILIPGLVSYFIYKRLTSRSNKRSDLMFISIAIFLGVLSYLGLQLITIATCGIRNICGSNGSYESLETFKSISGADIEYKEVLMASLLSVVIAFVLARMDTKNIINRLGIKFNVTKKETDETLYVAYLSKKEVDVVYIRDPKNNLTYFGKLFSFSEKENVKEIVLEDVTVYLYNEGTELYKIPSIYMTLNEDVTIEQANRLTQQEL